MTYTLLLDTSSLMYRAFFALPTSLADPGGRPINAVHGYLDMVTRLIGSLGPDEIVHVFDDDWRPAPRVAAFAGYKADRPPDPEALPAQWDVLRDVLDATGMTQAGVPGWEADDAIGSLSAQLSAGDRVDIVTGDRDLLQLVRDAVPVRVLFTTRGVSDLTTFDEAAVIAKYGIPPARYVDFATLRGDPSDGLPGVKGIGEKTARALVTRYPSLDALLDDLAAQPPRLAASLSEARAYLDAMRLVVPVRTDLTVRRSAAPRDDARLETLQATYNLNGPIRRLRAALDEARLTQPSRS
jgi:5'-3' exonuclease